MNRTKSHKYLSAARALSAGALALGAGCACAVGARAQGSVVGMVIGLKGAPQVKGSGAKLRLGARLSSGQIVRCAPGSEATVVLFASGQKFVIPAGREVRVAPEMKGAVPARVQGVSPEVARSLSGSRTGAVNMRRVEDGAPAASASGTFTQLDASLDYKTGSRPEVGLLAEGSRSLAWPGDLPISLGPEAGEASSGYVLWSLFDSRSDVIHHARLEPKTGGQVRTEIPAEVEISTRRPYVWRAVSYVPNADGRFRVLSARWGMVTWLSQADAKALGAHLPPPSTTPAKIASASPERAFVLAELLRQRGVDGGAWSLLSAMRTAHVPGAEGAFLDFYGGLPAIAQLYGAQMPTSAPWKLQGAK